MKVQACRGLKVVLENTLVCFIGPNINGVMGLLLTSVKNKSKKVPVYIKNGGYILFLEVLHYLRAFSYSPYISLAYMCVTVPTESNKYRYYAMAGTPLKKNSFPMDIL